MLNEKEERKVKKIIKQYKTIKAKRYYKEFIGFVDKIRSMSNTQDSINWNANDTLFKMRKEMVEKFETYLSTKEKDSTAIYIGIYQGIKSRYLLKRDIEKIKRSTKKEYNKIKGFFKELFAK